MPETGMVVVDTTPIIALATVRRLDLLREIYGQVIIPPAVRAELAAGGSHRAGADEVGTLPWIRTLAPRAVDERLFADLDRGEAEVIGLALEVDAQLVILDERLARRRAEGLGLGVTGTLGVLLKAKAAGLIDQVGPMVQAIRAAGIRLGDDLVRRVLQLAGESE